MYTTAFGLPVVQEGHGQDDGPAPVLHEPDGPRGGVNGARRKRSLRGRLPMVPLLRPMEGGLESRNPAERGRGSGRRGRAGPDTALPFGHAKTRSRGTSCHGIIVVDCIVWPPRPLNSYERPACTLPQPDGGQETTFADGRARASGKNNFVLFLCAEKHEISSEFFDFEPKKRFSVPQFLARPWPGGGGGASKMAKTRSRRVEVGRSMDHWTRAYERYDFVPGGKNAKNARSPETPSSNPAWARRAGKGGGGGGGAWKPLGRPPRPSP